MRRISLFVLAMLLLAASGLVWNADAQASSYRITIHVAPPQYFDRVEDGNRSLIKGDYDGAIGHFSDALKCYAGPSAYFGLSVAYLNKGNNFLASFCYEASRKLGMPASSRIEERLYPFSESGFSGDRHPIESGFIISGSEAFISGKRSGIIRAALGDRTRFFFVSGDDSYAEPCKAGDEDYLRIYMPWSRVPSLSRAFLNAR